MQEKVYLAQTDTTVGFLSRDYRKLNKIKKRPLDKPCIMSVGDFEELKQHTRVPKTHRNLLRRARKTTFIYPNHQSIRVVKDCIHQEFIWKHKWLYSSSANITNCDFDEKYARKIADEVVENEGGFFQAKASKIFLLSRNKIKKVRI